MSPITDPIESIIAIALSESGIVFVHSGEEGSGLPLTQGLDFYLPGFDIFIECKAYHAERVVKQMARVQNVIVIQGRSAALAFAAMLKTNNARP